MIDVKRADGPKLARLRRRSRGIATSVGGVLTGRGADPLKPEEALSQAQRQAANEWYDHTLYSRLNDKLSGAIVLIMHRLHEILALGCEPRDHLAGHVVPIPE